MKIAIIGGSFDPIHNGHLAMARHVLRHHLAAQVWFMLSKQTPLKDRVLTSFAIRAQMVKRAIAHDKRMRLCTLEQEREGLSYSVDTVRECKRRWPMHEFVWLLGNDQASQLHQWKDIDDLSEMIEFYVFPRNQETIECAYPHREMKMDLLDISSSEIRNGEKLWCLPKSVHHVMMEHALYTESIVHAHMREKRFLHSQSVAKLCVELARFHGVDEKHAYLAGMYHDLCKEWDTKRLTDWLAAMEPQRLQEPPAIWHGYVAAYYIAKAIGITNREIRNAIYHHVTGSGHTKLAMILFISDKLDPLRGYDTTKTLALCKQDLRQGFVQVKNEQRQYLKKERNNIHES